ncbi:RNA polymerase sigma factor [Streptomyces sp. NPDC057445]|uniref:RNA polymerase sigma factor n=1 Tax=Streptomyces sp. NPDC057445 TaxID=3346136 RepID=UPI0036CB535C
MALAAPSLPGSGLRPDDELPTAVEEPVITFALGGLGWSAAPSSGAGVVQDHTPESTLPLTDQSDTRGLDAFYAAHFDRMCRKLAVAAFRGDLTQAEDITQAAFVVAYRNWSSIAKKENPYGYVAKIAWNLAMKWHDAQKKERRSVALLAANPRSAAGVTDHSPLMDLEVDVARALSELPEHERIVAGLSLLLGYSPKEIASQLGEKPATVRCRLKRARERLKALLTDSEGGPSA